MGRDGTNSDHEDMNRKAGRAKAPFKPSYRTFNHVGTSLQVTLAMTLFEVARGKTALCWWRDSYI